MVSSRRIISIKLFWPAMAGHNAFGSTEIGGAAPACLWEFACPICDSPANAVPRQAVSLSSTPFPGEDRPLPAQPEQETEVVKKSRVWLPDQGDVKN